MDANKFLNQLDDGAIVAAIAVAEQTTSGEICVYVTRHSRPDTMRAAEKCFQRLKLNRTVERNAVLLYLAPVNQQLAIIGDQGIHEKVGIEFWETIAQEVSERLKRGESSAAVIHGVTRIGEVLARHFERKPDDQDELPNRVHRD